MDTWGGEAVGRQTSPARAALASFVGTATEYYDFFIYGTASALVFGQLFFPNVSPLAGTLSAFAAFGVGFLFRPLGGIFFGHYGDRIGRKAMLVITLLGMGAATFLIGLLPTYSSIGILAPILLVLLRIVQGFAVGGEYGGAAVVSVEHASNKRRGFYGSWTSNGAAGGFLLATAVFAVFSSLPHDDFLAWGWRIPFLLSAIVVAVGFWIRSGLHETPMFERVKQAHAAARSPVLEALRDYPRTIALVVGCVLGPNIAFFIATVYALSYATARLGVPNPTMLLILTITTIIGLIVQPLYGALSDRVGRRRILLVGLVVYVLSVFPFFWALESRSPILIFLGFVLLLNVAHSLGNAVTPSFFAELFGTRVRYSGVSIGFQLGAMLGGFSPFISAALQASQNGGWTYVATYTVAGLLLSLLAVVLARETYQEDLAAVPETDRAAVPALSTS